MSDGQRERWDREYLERKQRCPGCRYRRARKYVYHDNIREQVEGKLFRFTTGCPTHGEPGHD